MTIDEVVYNPRQATGRLATSVTKGLLRYAGGRISKQADVTFSTPTAAIGIRGGIALIEVAPNGATRASFVYGERMTVTAGGKTRTVFRVGYVLTVDDSGATPSDPETTTEEEVSRALHSFEGPRHRSTPDPRGEPHASVAQLTATERPAEVDSTSLQERARRLERRFDDDPDISEIERLGERNKGAQFRMIHQNHGHQHSNHGHKA